MSRCQTQGMTSNLAKFNMHVEGWSDPWENLASNFQHCSILFYFYIQIPRSRDAATSLGEVWGHGVSVETQFFLIPIFLVACRVARILLDQIRNTNIHQIVFCVLMSRIILGHFQFFCQDDVGEMLLKII